jgi:uncharacterized membrane protein YhaH (DUF805 family)
MNFGQAVKNGFLNYATFSGRASRSEYWYWILFVLVGSIVAAIADGLILNDMETEPIGLIFSVVTLLPGVAVSVRRLHDINKSGWWLLIALTGIGYLLLLYWAIQPSSESEAHQLGHRL